MFDADHGKIVSGEAATLLSHSRFEGGGAGLWETT
jgi:hypothetical protein